MIYFVLNRKSTSKYDVWINRKSTDWYEMNKYLIQWLNLRISESLLCQINNLSNKNNTIDWMHYFLLELSSFRDSALSLVKKIEFNELPEVSINFFPLIQLLLSNKEWKNVKTIRTIMDHDCFWFRWLIEES